MYTETAQDDAFSNKTIKCDKCDKEFRTEWELSSHKEVEHIRHLALAGVL
jgi:hypothetical protein